MLDENVRIIIGADVVPTAGNMNALANGDAAAVFNDVAGFLAAADFTIANLECPLTTGQRPITKMGPALKAAPASVNGLAAAGIKAYSLANNHILDYGAAGLFDTLGAIEAAGCRHAGAGENLAAAKKPLLVEIKGRKLAFLCVAEHEFSIAGEDSPGANPYDALDIFDEIRTLKASADALFVLYHGGAEEYRLPSPRLQKTVRKMAEQGADYVICQHSHCVGAYEQYLDSHLVYGQGNFLFADYDNELGREGLLVTAVVGREKTIGFTPIEKCGDAVRLAKDAAATAILAPFRERSAKLVDPQYVKAQWEAFCLSQQYRYLGGFSGLSDILLSIDYRLNRCLTKMMYDRKKIAALYDYTYCEAHHDAVKTLLQQLRGKIQ